MRQGRTMVVMVIVASLAASIIAKELDIPAPRNYVLLVHIKKGGNGTVRIDMLDITSRNKGEKGKQDVQKFVDALDSVSDEEMGLTNVSRDINRDSQGRLNVVVQGEAKDVFAIVKILECSSLLRLKKDAPLAVQWDGDVLSVDLASALGNMNPMGIGPDGIFPCKLVITTEGTFVGGTIGEITKDRKKLVVPNVYSVDNKTILGFKIKGLAAD